MPDLITDEQATGKTKDVFEEIRSAFGSVPNSSVRRRPSIPIGWN